LIIYYKCLIESPFLFTEDGARDDIDKVDGEQIRTFLSEFASTPHMAGLEADELLAVQLKAKWIELGLDQVTDWVGLGWVRLG
jgi:hypothetical protein